MYGDLVDRGVRGIVLGEGLHAIVANAVPVVVTAWQPGLIPTPLLARCTDAFGVGNMPDTASAGWLPWLRQQTRKVSWRLVLRVCFGGAPSGKRWTYSL